MPVTILVFSALLIALLAVSVLLLMRSMRKYKMPRAPTSTGAIVGESQ